MAAEGARPPDATLTKFYKCHPTTQVGAVVCILCESVYHTREIVAKYNAGCPVKFLSNTLIICQDHANVALTSNLPYGTLSREAKELIAQVKLIKKEQIKQEIISEIDLEKDKDKDKGPNETVYEDYNETQSLRIEIQLLKQLNCELQDKNRILNELLTKEKQGYNNNNNKIKSFAEITTSIKPKIKRIPKLIIKKTNNKDTTDIEKIVMQQLTLDKTIQTKSVACKNSDTVIINCTNEDSINTIENTLSNLLNSDIKIEKEQINKPKLKVINIDRTLEDEKVIEQDINLRNFNNMDSKCKVLHVYSNIKTGTNNAIIEVTSDMYKHIKDNKSRLFIGYQSCRVFDIINAYPCNKCSRFGHNSKKCRNEDTCSWCNGDHITSKCTHESINCPNCVYSNEKFKTNYKTNHCAIDSDLCMILKAKIKKYIEMTDYPVQPTYQRYFGKVERAINQQSITPRRGRLASSDSTGLQRSSIPVIPVTSKTTATN